MNVFAGTKTITLDIEGMGWGGSETRVSSILDQYKTITDYNTDTAAESATITFDDQKLDLAALRKELAKAGFQTDLKLHQEGTNNNTKQRTD